VTERIQRLQDFFAKHGLRQDYLLMSKELQVLEKD
jgi:hypothetical protein